VIVLIMFAFGSRSALAGSANAAVEAKLEKFKQAPSYAPKGFPTLLMQNFMLFEG
jgi:hypothetical protein